MQIKILYCRNGDLEILVAPIKVMVSQFFGYEWEIITTHVMTLLLTFLSSFVIGMCWCFCTGPEIAGLSNSGLTVVWDIWHPLHMYSTYIEESFLITMNDDFLYLYKDGRQWQFPCLNFTISVSHKSNSHLSHLCQKSKIMSAVKSFDECHRN